MVDKYRIDFGINSYMLLESEYGDLVKLKDYEQLEAENKRLKEALEFYAYEPNWHEAHKALKGDI